MGLDDENLLKLALENNEEAQEALYKKYKYIVDILLHKYNSIALSLGIDLNELEGEAYYAFSDALISYKKNKNAKLATFISLCIDRRLKKLIKKYSSLKAKALNNTYSLDYDYNDEGLTLQDVICDNKNDDPLNKLTSKENYEELLRKIKERLSESEYDVFSYYVNDFDYITIAKIQNKNPKQIDNTIQRIKHKIRDIIRED